MAKLNHLLQSAFPESLPVGGPRGALVCEAQRAEGRLQPRSPHTHTASYLLLTYWAVAEVGAATTLLSCPQHSSSAPWSGISSLCV